MPPKCERINATLVFLGTEAPTHRFPTRAAPPAYTADPHLSDLDYNTTLTFTYPNKTLTGGFALGGTGDVITSRHRYRSNPGGGVMLETLTFILFVVAIVFVAMGPKSSKTESSKTEDSRTEDKDHDK